MTDNAAPRAGSLEAGIDWFSATLPAGHQQSGATYHAGFNLLDSLAEQGNQAAEKDKLGYRGVQCGKLFVGESKQGLIIIATGSTAALAFEHTYITDMHVSRLDLQVTVWGSPDGEQTGHIAETEAIGHKSKGGKGNKRKIRHIEDDEGGYTLYVGSRHSASFMRLYNKGAETKEEYYAGAWRYEVEMHNQAASLVSAALNTAGEHLEASIAATVANYYRRRGISVPWKANEAMDVLRPLPTDEPDDIRSIKWLKAQVRPTVQRLIRSGYLPDVLQALGMGQD